MKKEFLIFIFLFVVLSLLLHYEQWFTIPLTHLTNLSNSGAYGLGALHPFIFTFIAYIFLWLPRGILKVIKNIKK